MTTQTKVFLLGSVLAAALFTGIWYFYIREDPNEKLKEPVTGSQMEEAAQAYALAVQEGVPQATLDEMNSDYAKMYGIRIYQRKSDGVFVITDTAGKQIKEMS